MSTLNPINAAQKVRLWFMLGLSIIQALAILVLGTMPGYQLALGKGDAEYGWLLVTFVANVTLGSVSLYRFLHPLARHAQPMVAYQPAPTQYGQAYGQNPYPPPPPPGYGQSPFGQQR